MVRPSFFIGNFFQRNLLFPAGYGFSSISIQLTSTASGTPSIFAGWKGFSLFKINIFSFYFCRSDAIFSYVFFPGAIFIYDK